MITALVASFSAACYGVSDLLGGVASRRDEALPVTITAQATGLVLVGVLCLLLPPESWRDPRILWGLGAGVFGGTGVLALYAGLATGRMSVVAPVTAALTGTIPAAFGILQSGLPGPITLAGMSLAIAAVVIVSVFAEDEGDGSARTALVFALLSGAGFGISILCWAQTPVSTQFAPLLVARTTTVTLFLIASAIGRRRPFAAPDALRMALLTGAVDVTANLSQVVALRIGPVALAAVVGSLYPVVTVLLARFYLHEHLRGWQRIGIVMALVSVVLCALPS